MIGAIIEFDDLRKLCRLGERAKLASVERWTKRAGICYQYDGRGGIWTTLDAMNAAVGLGHDEKPGQYSVERVV
jgi:predicted metal-dependent phosphoesterase TrpH